MGLQRNSQQLFDSLETILQDAADSLQQLRQNVELGECTIIDCDLLPMRCGSHLSLNHHSSNSTHPKTSLNMPSEICLRDMVPKSSDAATMSHRSSSQKDLSDSVTWEVHPKWQPDIEKSQPLVHCESNEIRKRVSVLDNYFCEVNTRENSKSRWHPWTFPPTSVFRQYWVYASFIVAFYDLFIAPMEVFFDTDFAAKVFRTFLLSSASYWTASIPLKFFFASYDFTGVPEGRLKVVMVRYMRSWFIFDLATVVLDWTSLVSKESGIRLLRVVRVLPIWIECSQVIGSAFSFNIAVFGILCAYLHVNACFWFRLCTWKDLSMHTSYCGIEDTSAIYRYLTSVHTVVSHFRTTALPTPANMVLRIYVVCVSLIALVASPLLVGKITTILVSIEASRRQSQKSHEQLRSYLGENKVSHGLRQRIWSFLLRMPASKPIIDSDVDLLKMLPIGLANDLKSQVLQPWLARHPFFDHLFNGEVLSKSQRRAIINQCLEELWLRFGTPIFAAGEHARRRMLFIKSGQIEYSVDDTMIEPRSALTRISRKKPSDFGKQTMKTMLETTSLFAMMRDAEELAPQDRVWIGGSYRATINARDVVTWLVDNGICSDRRQATEVGRDLQRRGLITHVWDLPAWITPFMDTEMYFCYTERALMIKGTERLLGPGDWLCEQSLWLNAWRHCGAATVASETYCALLAVDAESLQKVIASVPIVQAYAILFVELRSSYEIGLKTESESLVQMLTQEHHSAPTESQ